MKFLCVLAAVLVPVALQAAARPVRTATEVGLENDTARIIFDVRTGQLLSLRNVARGDEYLKDRRDDGGPFTIFSDFRADFDIGSPGSVPRASTDPAAIADSIVAPPACRLTSSSFRRASAGLALQLTLQDLAARWQADLEVWLPDQGGASAWDLQVTNRRAQPSTLMVAFPDISGFRLGDGAANMQTMLRDGGGIAPAWTKAGGLYGNGGQMSMQWHALFDRPAGDHLGLIVADPEVRNKWFHFIKPRIAVIYFPPERLAPGQIWKSPRTQLMIGNGDWKPVARAYRDWFASAFRLVERPAWLDRIDGWMGAWFAKKGGVLPPGGCTATAHCLDSFAELAEIYRELPVDLHEYAFHTQGSSRDPMVHTDGDNVLRDDLGGAPALKEGLSRVHQLGYRFAFYIEGYIVHQSSELAKSGKAARMSLMHKDGTITGNYTKQGFYHMCPGSTEWQDHLAGVASRLVRETGADAIRLDSLGYYFLSCYHPAHRHPSPFGYNVWIQELFDKVSRAVRAANPDCAFTTEAPVDFYAQYFHGALHSTTTFGREIPPMRLALPAYRPFNYQGVGPIYGSLSGLPGGSNGYGAGADLIALDENWRAMRHGVAATLAQGEVSDEDPQPSLADVTCRLFHGAGHSVVVCARVEGAESLNFPKEIRLARDRRPYTVRLRGLRQPVEAAYLYDIERASAASVKLRREGQDWLVPIESSNWFMAVLRAPGGPAVATIDPVGQLHAGESKQIELRLLSATPKARATLSARGLTFAGTNAHSTTVEVPGKATLVAPPGTPPGRYQIELDGPGLIGMKRFVVVAP